jgi:V8-like Glu-specific endopeptidase
MKRRLRVFVGACVASTLLAASMVDADAQNSPSVAQDPAANRGPDSASPYARVPDFVLDAKPIMPPAPRAVPLPANPLDTEVYDATTGQTTIIAAPPATPEIPGVRTTAPYAGLLPDPSASSSLPGPGTESVIGADGRVQISPATAFPWRTIVSIYVTFPNGEAGGCTGEMIDGYRLYTAGHCVHNGAWYSTLTVYPGRDGSSMPYHYAKATYARSYTGWTVSKSHEHDWSVVTLDRRIGNFTGWMGRITRGCVWPYINGVGCDGLYFGTWNTAGYPDTAPDGTAGNGRMYYDADTGQKANDNNHWYYNDTRPGNSGGPVWYFDGTNRYIGTIHAYGDDGSGANHGTRLNQDKYDRTISWLTDGGDGAPPTDRPDVFDDGAAYFYGSPTPATRGITTMSVGSDERNNGTAAAGGHWNRYVLSSNNIISTGDYTLCEAFVASIGTFAWANSDCSTVVPNTIPAGSYYLGVIYDVYGNLVEFDESNNTAYRTTLYTIQNPVALTVTRAGTGTGTVTSAPGGISCGADCTQDYAPGTGVTLTAAAAAGSAFTGWGGACTGTAATCFVSMNAAKSVTATFQPSYALSVSKLGNGGSGTVTSAPAGINCGGDCSEDYVSGTTVTLSAAQGPGSVFAGWGGACTGTGNCVVSMTEARSVTATFNIPPELTSFVLTKAEVAGCKSVTGKLALNVPAPAGGFTVTVTDTLANATPPATVTFAAGAITKSFAIKSTAVGSKQNGQITVKGTVASISQPLALRPMGMLSVSLTPNPVVGGAPVSGIAKLECAAGPGSITAALSSTLPGTAQPTVASLTFPAGTQSLPFTVNTTAVATITKPRINAVANGITKYKVLTVNPPPP